MVCEFDTCIKVTQFVCVGLCSGQYIQICDRSLRRSGQIEQTLGRGRVFECIEYAIVRIRTQTERVTGFQDPLVSYFRCQHHVDVELDTVTFCRLLSCIFTRYRFIQHRNTLCREVC